MEKFEGIFMLNSYVWSILKKYRGNAIFLVVLISLIIVWSYTKPFLHLSENQLLYLFSTSAQVLAAIYGLVLTGYSLFRKTLDEKAQNDNTLDGITDYIASGWYKQNVGISVLTFFAEVLCLATISYRNGPLLNFLINLSESAVVCDLYFIILFVIKITRPDGIVAASDAIVQKRNKNGGPNLKKGGDSQGSNGGNGANGENRDDNGSDGSRDGDDERKNHPSLDGSGLSETEYSQNGWVGDRLKTFLSVFQEIESMLDKASKKYAYESNRRRLSNRGIANNLSKEKIIPPILKNQLDDLIVYRNGLIHGSISLEVSENMVSLAIYCEKYLRNT